MKVTFNINFHTIWGQKLCIVGSIPELGSWNSAFAKEMRYSGEGNWQLQLDLPSETKAIEYRYFICANEKQVFEEWEKNHSVLLEESANCYTLFDYWQVRPVHLAFYSSAFVRSLFAHPCDKFERVVKTDKRLIIKISAPRVCEKQSLCITGNQSSLGNWNPAEALILACDRFPEWEIVLNASELTFPLEYKFLVSDNITRQPVYWESGENRVLTLPEQASGETVSISGLRFHDDLPLWRCAGTVVPVFSLRSETSFGVGDLHDLKKLIDWIRCTRQRIIQVLPMNDTTQTHTSADSYPYCAISTAALHPMYISLTRLGTLNDAALQAHFNALQEELNRGETVDYERMLQAKLEYCRAFYEQEGKDELNSEGFHEFFARNKSWLLPYAAYSYLRDKYHTADFGRWEDYALYDAHKIEELCASTAEAGREIAFSYYLQYILHTQFKAVSDYARSHHVVLKGDIPIGVSRTGVEAWTEPAYFNMTGQAGAPPDDFAVMGQNWGFPTYNWAEMNKDNYVWWKKRFRKMSDYFDAFRIDHILGFFRIWEVPLRYVEGLCGHFTPALPFHKDEIEQYGLTFNEKRFTIPHINRCFLPELFGEYTDEAIDNYLMQSTAHHWVLKPDFDTQRKIEQRFAEKKDTASAVIKAGLFAIANEVLFLEDPNERNRFHPRVSASQSYVYKELNNEEQFAFDQLYWHFFYHRHNDFWKEKAFKRLTPLVNSTDMLVCGEDLGMIPDSVPDVMNKLQLLSLEIERMPKSPQREFTDLHALPYHAVCTTSTHDMAPLRSWWNEDAAKTQRYYNAILQHPGNAPDECSSDLCAEIIANHLNSPAMLTIIPVQDWFALSDKIKRADIEAERINIPANPAHYWCYRMHITIEELMQADELNNKITSLIEKSGRN